VQPDRGSDLVVAGMNPAKSIGASSAFSRIHRGTTFIVFIDGLIVLWIGFAFASNLLPENLQGIIIALLAIANLMVWNGYKNRARWAYWPAAGIIGLACLFFALNVLISIIDIMNGNVSSLLLTFLIGWATFGSARRVMFHFNQSYSSGYFSTSSGDSDFDLGQGEMLAACPTCLAVLAIIPNMLNASDRCPHCQSPLIDPELAQKYGMDSEE
tara:strand:+ start:2097 stop:2735 length:639 start_codon:yes stop_codon:yes gene_type:complete